MDVRNVGNQKRELIKIRNTPDLMWVTPKADKESRTDFK